MSDDLAHDAEAENELRRLSCYTTPPARTLELFEYARGKCPVAHVEQYDGYELLVDYEDVKEATVNYAKYSSEPQVMRPILDRPQIPALEMDPPRHKSWREVFDRAVPTAAVDALEPKVRADVNGYVDSFIGRGRADLVADLAEPIPAESICHLIGVDDRRMPMLVEKAMAMAAASGDPEEFGRRQVEFGEVALAEIEDRRRAPRDDYLTYLTEVQVDGRKLAEGDFVMLLVSFLTAGHHSTTSAMASLIFDVFSSPDTRDRLKANPKSIPRAVEESLRLHAPFYGFYRRTTDQVDVGGTALPAGSDVYVGWAAANRDPKVYEKPEEFSLDLPRRRHLSFGFGKHVCPGSRLARMELRVVLEELLRRIPDLHIEIDEPHYEFGGSNYVYLTELPVTFVAR